MKFTYRAYEAMLNLLKEYEYLFCKYDDYKDKNKAVILRHDVDMSLDAALALAELEYNNNVKSTYFVLLSTDFYNIFSKNSKVIINKILNMNHTVGLHFDEVKYNCKNIEDIVGKIYNEINVLELCIGKKVNTVSMHRPSALVLDNDINLDNIINSYSKEFFNNFKYVSDSRMNWREDVEKVISSGEYNKLHILTHPFWYKTRVKCTKEILTEFIEQSKYSTYYNLNDNFRNLSEFVKFEDI